MCSFDSISFQFLKPESNRLVVIVLRCCLKKVKVIYWQEAICIGTYNYSTVNKKQNGESVRGNHPYLLGSSRHFIFHQKYVWLSNPFPSKPSIVFWPQKPLYSQPIPLVIRYIFGASFKHLVYRSQM